MALTLEQFERLEDGMTYDEAVAAMGAAPELVSSEAQQIEPGIQLMQQMTNIYEWKDDEGRVVRAMFIKGELREKTQFGLE